MNVGATAMVARSKGAGDPEKANLFLRQALLMTLTFSVVSAVLGYIFAEPLVRFMGAADPQTLAGGVSYLRIQMLGLVFLALTSTVTATLRGAGNSRTAMVYNVISNVINVIFNYLLIYGNFGFPRMEVAGASLATIIGQMVAFVLAYRAVMSGRNYLHLRLSDGFRPSKDALSSIVKIGLPAMVEQLIMRAGVIIYTKMVASLGTVPYATHQICLNIQALSFMNGQAFAVSATSLVGQSLGKKRPDMAQAYSKRTRRIALLVSIFLASIFFFFGRNIIGLYTKEAEIIATGSILMMLVAVVQPLQSSQFVLAGALRGAGDTKSVAVCTFLTILLVRPGIAYITIFGLGWGVIGAWIALVIDQAIRSGLIMLRFYSGKWKQIKI
ncbi:MAG: MATE family efflux transporter, partial [Oscillospiraceae bacterium]|jgi:putative MATE family efflux protein|nr:MATE family efflux transporter [Oscillospiraceae bacterium]